MPRLVRTLAAVVAAASAVAFPLALNPSPSAAATGSSKVTIVHAVPGLTVDVFANGKKLLSGFKPGTMTDPVTLAAGTYNLAVFPTGQGPSGTPAIKADGVKVPAGANLSVVAHLNAAGTPVLTPYVNDVSRTKPGQARLTVRHDAAAPAVDVRANGKVAFSNLVNPKEAKADLPAGSISADVVLAGTSTVAIGPATLNLKEGTNTIVYAWGSAANNNLALAVQTISGLHQAPSGVPAGNAGLAGDEGFPVALVALTGLVLAAALLTGGRALVAARR